MCSQNQKKRYHASLAQRPPKTYAASAIPYTSGWLSLTVPMMVAASGAVSDAAAFPEQLTPHDGAHEEDRQDAGHDTDNVEHLRDGEHTEADVSLGDERERAKRRDLVCVSESLKRLLTERYDCVLSSSAPKTASTASVVSSASCCPLGIYSSTRSPSSLTSVTMMLPSCLVSDMLNAGE